MGKSQNRNDAMTWCHMIHSVIPIYSQYTVQWNVNKLIHQISIVKRILMHLPISLVSNGIWLSFSWCTGNGSIRRFMNHCTSSENVEFESPKFEWFQYRYRFNLKNYIEFMLDSHWIQVLLSNWNRSRNLYIRNMRNWSNLPPNYGNWKFRLLHNGMNCAMNGINWEHSERVLPIRINVRSYRLKYLRWRQSANEHLKLWQKLSTDSMRNKPNFGTMSFGVHVCSWKQSNIRELHFIRNILINIRICWNGEGRNSRMERIHWNEHAKWWWLHLRSQSMEYYPCYVAMSVKWNSICFSLFPFVIHIDFPITPLPGCW